MTGNDSCTTRARSRRTRTVAVAALALVAMLAPALVATTTATAADPPPVKIPSITFTPSGPFSDGDEVTVSYTGFSANAPIAVAVCPRGRVQQGPGDCGRSKSGHAKLTTADAAGAGSALLVVPEGALGNATPPAATCGYVHPCVFSALNIADLREQDRATVPYVLPTEPTIGINPGGPVQGGTAIDVIATGFAPDAPVAIGQGEAGRPALGPGDMGRSKNGQSKLVTSTPRGVARATLIARYGPLENAIAPAIFCGASNCVINALNIADAEQILVAPLQLATTKNWSTTSIKLSRTLVKRGAKVTFRGNVTLPSPGATVKLQRSENNVWRTKKTTKLDQHSNYGFSWTPTTTIDYRWRVVFQGSQYNAWSMSKPVKLRVV